MPKRAPLNDAELDRIAVLREVDGLTYRRIAEKIGCSDGSVYWACLRLGIDRPDLEAKPLPAVPSDRRSYKRGDHLVHLFTDDDDAELLRLEAAGVNPHAIGLLLSPRRAPNSVVGRLRSLARRAARAEAAALIGADHTNPGRFDHQPSGAH